jgi:subtilisin family serine protease
MRCAAVLALLVTAAFASPASASPGEATGRLLVSFEQPGERARAAAPAVLARASARRSGPSVRQIGLVTVRPSGGRSLRALAARLRRDPAVRSVTVERRARPRHVPDDPALTDPETTSGTPPGTAVQWWAQRLGLFEAWDRVRGDGTLIAVLDSGVDGQHPELAGKVRGTIDADDTSGEGGPLVDEDGHGTHVASLACAASNQGVGFAGAGHDCGLLVAKTDFGDASVARAIVEATDRGAQVINLSFGTDGGRTPPTALVDALRYAARRGVVLVAAAADQETDEQGDPANVLQPTGTGPDLEQNLGLSVTAATHSDNRAWFAGRGTQISLAAYGAFERSAGPRGLLAAWPQNSTTFERGNVAPSFVPACRCRTTFRGDPRYAYLQGTSMATALVSAVAALTRQANPDLRGPDVVRLLKQTARRSGGWSPELGWGIVDARAAVAAARRLDRRPPVSTLRAPRQTRTGSIALRWSGRDDAPAGVRASGVSVYEVWRSANGRAPRRIARTRRTALRVKARAGSVYRFFTVAVDRAGNREQAPGAPTRRSARSAERRASTSSAMG